MSPIIGCLRDLSSSSAIFVSGIERGDAALIDPGKVIFLSNIDGSDTYKQISMMIWLPRSQIQRIVFNSGNKFHMELADLHIISIKISLVRRIYGWSMGFVIYDHEITVRLELRLR